MRKGINITGKAQAKTASGASGRVSVCLWIQRWLKFSLCHSCSCHVSINKFLSAHTAKKVKCLYGTWGARGGICCGNEAIILCLSLFIYLVTKLESTFNQNYFF